jgi:hypothetical protein
MIYTKHTNTLYKHPHPHKHTHFTHMRTLTDAFYTHRVFTNTPFLQTHVHTPFSCTQTLFTHTYFSHNNTHAYMQCEGKVSREGGRDMGASRARSI